MMTYFSLFSHSIARVFCSVLFSESMKEREREKGENDNMIETHSVNIIYLFIYLI